MNLSLLAKITKNYQIVTSKSFNVQVLVIGMDLLHKNNGHPNDMSNSFFLYDQ